MSDYNNDQLTELAHDHSEYWVGTVMGAVIDNDLETGDYEALEAHLKESAQLMFERDYQPEPMTDEIADQIWKEASDVF